MKKMYAWSAGVPGKFGRKKAGNTGFRIPDIFRELPGVLAAPREAHKRLPLRT